MKKTLAAVAVLGAFAGSALAADVTLYGVVDTGFLYKHVDKDAPNTDADNTFEMKSGQQAGSRFGLKGVEDLGNGLKVGFVLEKGFNSDAGTNADNDYFFDRESSLFIEGGFGKLAMGRIGSINQGASSWGKVGMISAFGTSYGDYVANATSFISAGSKLNNMVAYQTPDFAGFKVYAQYGMGNKDGKDENKSSTDRYYALGATYNNGPIAGYFAVDSINYETAGLANAKDIDDSITVTLGGSYDFEVVKVFFGAQYFDEVKKATLKGLIDGTAGTGVTLPDELQGYGLGLSLSAPLGGGTGLFGVSYLDAEQAQSAPQKKEVTRWTVSAGYSYPLSKRTNVYAAATYTQNKIELADKDQKPSAYGAMVGLRHNF